MDEIKSKLDSNLYNEVVFGLRKSFENKQFKDTIYFADSLITWEKWHEIAHEFKYLSNIALGEKSKAKKEMRKFVADYKSEFSSIPEFENSINI